MRYVTKKRFFQLKNITKTPYLHTRLVTQCDNIYSVKRVICNSQRTKKWTKYPIQNGFFVPCKKIRPSRRIPNLLQKFFFCISEKMGFFENVLPRIRCNRNVKKRFPWKIWDSTWNQFHDKNKLFFYPLMSMGKKEKK